MTISERKFPWADSPFKLISKTGQNDRPEIPTDHYCRFYATEMSLIHNSFLRAFNASYNQALHIPAAPAPSLAADFLRYNQTIYHCLHEHHTTEETTMFPMLEELTGIKGLMDGNIEQHKAFDSGLTVFKDYVFNTKPENFSGARLREILESFGFILQDHLHDEIPTLLALHIYDSKKLKDIWAKAEEAALSGLDYYEHRPLIFGTQDLSFKIDGKDAVFPSVPFFVPYLMQFVYARKFRDVWRFNPSSSLRVRRPLQFTGEA